MKIPEKPFLKKTRLKKYFSRSGGKDKKYRGDECPSLPLLPSGITDLNAHYLFQFLEDTRPILSNCKVDLISIIELSSLHFGQYQAFY